MSKHTRAANKASAEQLALSLQTQKLDEDKYNLRAVMPQDLSAEERHCIWDIFEQNMKDAYVYSSFGWDPPKKQAELFDDASRFLLVFARERENPNPPLVGYAMFRFEQDDEEEHDIVYCYELQISRSTQRSGLGKVLMMQLNAIGRAWKMEKVMLTVFKENRAAVQFYHSCGFALDPSSPDFPAEDEEEWADEDEESNSGSEQNYDYQILSKSLTT